jgi:signal transduction histidine kinase
VFTNVLDNAIRASDRGQRIVIRCRDQADAANGAAGMVHIAISDQGTGIPADQLEKIFDRFHQVSPGGRRRKGGTGLGLAISREITEHHGGRIWAESGPDAGSTFHITLPRATRAASIRPPSASAGATGTTSPGDSTHA